MEKEEVRNQLTRDPFVPLRLYIKDGRKLDVPVRQAAYMQSHGVLVLLGVKPGTYVIKGYDVIGFDAIERIEQRPKAEKGKRRKAG
jgi:hypothetical protein